MSKVRQDAKGSKAGSKAKHAVRLTTGVVSNSSDVVVLRRVSIKDNLDGRRNGAASTKPSVVARRDTGAALCVVADKAGLAATLAIICCTWGSSKSSELGRMLSPAPMAAALGTGTHTCTTNMCNKHPRPCQQPSTATTLNTTCL